MLDPRIYRAACVPILFALVLVGFSLRELPRPLAPSLAPDAFDGAAAFRQLERLADEAPVRRPGSAGDVQVAARVDEALRAAGFRVERDRFDAETADGRRALTTVAGVRAGFSSRRILVLAQRDALGRGARAQLSGTAALLELARVLGGRTLDRTLVLASTSGGSAGLAAARRLAAEPAAGAAPIDAVLVLGDLASARADRPLVVPWSESEAIAPLRLRRTVEAAVAAEARLRAGSVAPGVQLARLAAPVTLGEQGPFNARGIGAVLLSVSGERAPAADAPVSAERLEAFGRAALRSVGALDAGAEVGASEPYLVLERKVLPAWAMRLLALVLVLPVLLAAIDGLARVRRRRGRLLPWLRWVGVSTVPFVLAALTAIVFFRAGLLEAAPPAVLAGGAVPVSWAPLAAVALVLVLAWLLVRPRLRRLVGVPGEPAGAELAGAATATLLVLCAAALVVWLVNPFTCLLLVPALHAWLLATAPETRVRRPLALALWAAGLLAPLLVAYALARQLGLGPLELAWAATLLVAGGGIGPLAVLGWCVVLGASAAALVLVLREPGDPAGSSGAPVTVRGPMTYAGPGSLGGTDSALRR